VQHLSDRISFINKISSKNKVLHMDNYTQIKEFERVAIYEGLKVGLSQGKIAKLLGRDKSSISRELNRNSDQFGYLYPRDAQKCAEDRKAKHGTKINRRPALKAYVIEKLKLGWSPAVIAGRWKIEKSKLPGTCAEAIYQFIYDPKNKKLALWEFLPRQRKKRGIKRKSQQANVAGIQHRVSVHDRPEEINMRDTVGHYEADLMFNKGSQAANVLTIVERKSRMVFLVKHESKHSKPIIESLEKKIKSTAKSCTFDNGKEFALHHLLNILTFFCDPGSPWQKGSVENMNGLLRRYLPFELDPHSITQDYLDHVALTINNIPRKILGFLTPYEVFMQSNIGQESSRVKPALPAAEVFYQNFQSVALHP
jgi:IS30 family transposase